MRLFIAIEFDNTTREKIYQIQTELKEANPDIKWVEKENLHLTLKFIGETEETKIDDIKETIRTVVQTNKKFVISFFDIGVFPDIQSPRVLWLGINKGKEQLCSLSEQLDRNLSELEFEKEKRKFAGHLTIGRFRSHKNVVTLTKKFQKIQPGEICETEIGCISLIQSKLTPKGPIYTELIKYNLCD